jgi:hypothetical protein
MVCPPTTSEAEARWPRFGLVVVAATSRRDNKDQMIRPLEYIWGVFVKYILGYWDLSWSLESGVISEIF